MAEQAGLHLDEWQQSELVNALGERADGKWAASRVCLVVPRQNGKGSILEARALAGLFLFGEQLIIWTAHEFKTSQEAYRRLLSLIEDTPHLDKLVKQKLNNTTATSIELHSGQRIKFIARSGGSGRGFSGDCVIFDEAFNLPAEMMSALSFTKAARPNPQTWYTSSAPLPRSESDTLRRICRQGRRAVGDRLAYGEYGVLPADNLDLDDRALWSQGNPGFVCGRLLEETIEDERSDNTDEDFARERLGIWVDDEDTSGSLPSWHERAVEGIVPRTDLHLTLDVAPKSAWSSIGIGGRSGDQIVLDLADHQVGTGWVVERLKELRTRHKIKSAVWLDPASPAGALIPDLEKAGIPVEQMSTRDMGQACEGLYVDVEETGRVAHPGRPETDKAVAGAASRDVGGLWLWERKAPGVVVSPLVAITIARWAVLQAENTTSVYESGGVRVLG